MSDYRIISFNDLGKADLLVDALYKGGNQGNAADDPINRLVGCGNQGGFRYVGSIRARIKLCVLYSSLSDVDWPDTLDPEAGIFSYFGDNKKPGHGLHETRRMGNKILKETFNALHSEKRETIPPFFIFTKGPSGRDVFFRGLGVPGAKGLSSREDLVAIWKTKDSQRFQNYRATFTILDVPTVTRRWITDIHELNPISENAPSAWRDWTKGGDYRPLMAPRTVTYRSKQEQLPSEGMKRNILNTGEP